MAEPDQVVIAHTLEAEALGPKLTRFGSRRALPLPAGARAEWRFRASAPASP